MSRCAQPTALTLRAAFWQRGRRAAAVAALWAGRRKAAAQIDPPQGHRPRYGAGICGPCAAAPHQGRCPPHGGNGGGSADFGTAGLGLADGTERCVCTGIADLGVARRGGTVCGVAGTAPRPAFQGGPLRRGAGAGRGVSGAAVCRAAAVFGRCGTVRGCRQAVLEYTLQRKFLWCPPRRFRRRWACLRC